jgi:hypothetical protein
MSNQFTESVVEDAALEWFGELGYRVVHGPDIAPGEPASERQSYEQVVLEGRLREALATLNPAKRRRFSMRAWNEAPRACGARSLAALSTIMDTLAISWPIGRKKPSQIRHFLSATVHDGVHEAAQLRAQRAQIEAVVRNSRTTADDDKGYDIGRTSPPLRPQRSQHHDA